MTRRQLAALLLGLALAGCGALDAEVSSDAPPLRLTGLVDGKIEGIDVSYYQGEIDWGAVRADGISFAWIKATEGGDRLDERFLANWQAAGRAGLARGAYHFWYHCRPGIEQARWFIANVPRDKTALPPVLDMEWTPFSPTCTDRPTADVLHKEMQDWLDAVERHYGRKAVIYTSVDFYRDRLVGAFTDHHLWVRSVADHPSVRYGDRKWHFWQYTATGSVAGVTGEVDRNVFYGTAAEFNAFLAGTHVP